MLQHVRVLLEEKRNSSSSTIGPVAEENLTRDCVTWTPLPTQYRCRVLFLASAEFAKLNLGDAMLNKTPSYLIIRSLFFTCVINLGSFSPKKDGKSSPSPVEKKRVTESDIHRKESFQKVLFQIVSNAARHNDSFFRDDATTKSNERCKEFHCVVLHIVPSI